MSNTLKNWWQRRKKLQVLRQIGKSEPKFYAGIPRIIRIGAIDRFLEGEKKANERAARLRAQADSIENKFGEQADQKGDFIDDSFKIVEMRLKREQPEKWRRFFKDWRKR